MSSVYGLGRESRGQETKVKGQNIRVCMFSKGGVGGLQKNVHMRFLVDKIDM